MTSWPSEIVSPVPSWMTLFCRVLESNGVGKVAFGEFTPPETLTCDDAMPGCTQELLELAEVHPVRARATRAAAATSAGTLRAGAVRTVPLSTSDVGMRRTGGRTEQDGRDPRSGIPC
ncbi:hypothetical protein GCM10027568_06860 [Humibacter soli]